MCLLQQQVARLANVLRLLCLQATTHMPCNFVCPCISTTCGIRSLQQHKKLLVFPFFLFFGIDTEGGYWSHGITAIHLYHPSP
jgi:hypothetical protein